MSIEILKNILIDIVFNKNNVYNGHYQTVFPVMDYQNIRELVDVLSESDPQDYFWEIRLYPEANGGTSCTVYRTYDQEQIVFAVDSVTGI